jgi:hypothetical protein
MKLLPNIQPNELRLDQSVDDIFRKFAHENDVLSKTIKNIGSSSIRSLSPASSTRSTSPSSLSRQPTTKNRSSTRQETKWTCMVCLSKHALSVDLCSICGSNKPEPQQPHHQLSPASIGGAGSSSINFAKSYSKNQLRVSSSSANFTNYLLNELGKTKEFQQDASSSARSSPSDHQDPSCNSLLSSSNNNNYNSKANPYLKKWTCNQCNFSNDSLKIVCLNCRWVKSSTTDPKKAIKLLNETAVSSSMSKAMKSPLRESESEKQQQSSEVAAESPIKKTKNSAEQESQGVLPSPAQSLLLLGFANTKKWTCSTCLVQNEDKLTTCLACQSSKTRTESTTTTTTNATASITSSVSSPTPLIDIFKPAITSSKWTCSTCLIPNENKNSSCLACQTPKSSNTATLTSTTSSTSSLLIKSQTVPLITPSNNKLECSSYLVKNDADKLKCVCSQSEKPCASNKSQEPQATSTTISNTGGFKFGTLGANNANSEPIKFGTSSNLISLLNKTPSAPATTITAPFISFGLPTNKPSLGETDDNKTQPLLFNSFPTTSLSNKIGSGDSKEKESNQNQASSIFNFKPLTGSSTTTQQASTSSEPSAKAPILSFGTASTNAPFKFGETTSSNAPSTDTNTTTCTTATITSTSVAAPTSTPLLNFSSTPSPTSGTSSFQGLTGLSNNTNACSANEAQIKSFSLFNSTPIKNSETSNLLASGNTSSLFGAATTQKTSSTDQPQTSTSSASLNFFGNTPKLDTQQLSLFKFSQTTPATSTISATTPSGGFFSCNSNTTPGSFFGVTSTTTTAANTTNITSQPSIFGTTPSNSTLSFDTSTTTAPPSSTSNFGSLFAKPAESTSSSGGLFGNMSTTASSSTNQQPSFQFSFQSPTTNNNNSTITPSTSNTATPSLLQTAFFNTPKASSQPSTLMTPASTQAQPQSSLFGGLNSSASSTGSLFNNTAIQPTSTTSTFISSFGNTNASSTSFFSSNLGDNVQTASNNTSLFGGENNNNNFGLNHNMNNVAPVASGFKFDLKPDMNFNFGVPNTNPAGFIQFS